jgi:hypothetical protein
MKARAKLKTGVSRVIGLLVVPQLAGLVIMGQTSGSWIPTLLIVAILAWLGGALYLMNSGWNGK